MCQECALAIKFQKISNAQQLDASCELIDELFACVDRKLFVSIMLDFGQSAFNYPKSLFV